MTAKFRGYSPLLWEVYYRARVLDHETSPISGVQHFPRVLLLVSFLYFPIRAVCHWQRHLDGITAP